MKTGIWDRLEEIFGKLNELTADAMGFSDCEHGTSERMRISVHVEQGKVFIYGQPKAVVLNGKEIRPGQ